MKRVKLNIIDDDNDNIKYCNESNSITNLGNHDKYLELLFNVIGQDPQQIGWNFWFQIAGCLKSNNCNKNIFLEFNDKINFLQASFQEVFNTKQLYSG